MWPIRGSRIPPKAHRKSMLPQRWAAEVGGASMEEGRGHGLLKLEVPDPLGELQREVDREQVEERCVDPDQRQNHPRDLLPGEPVTEQILSSRYADQKRPNAAQ